MQKFSKKQIALAVSSSLLAGSALAAAPVFNDAATSIQDVTASATGATVSGTNQEFYTTGVKQPVAIKALMKGVLSGGDAAPALKVNDATDSDIQVYALNGATKINLVVTTAGAYTAGTSGANDASITFTIEGVATDTNYAFKVKAGKLYYIPDTKAATPAEYQVKFDFVKSASAPLAQEAAAIDATAGIEIYSAIVPTAQVLTTATNNLVDGVAINTFAKVTSFDATNVTVKSQGVTTAPDATAFAASGFDYLTATVKPVVAGSGSALSVKFAAPLTVDWNNDTKVDDTDKALYVAKYFHTGVEGTGAVAGTDLPFTVALSATVPTFDEVFVAATGAKANVPALPAAEDGVKPVLLGADANNQSLSLIFSEPITFIGGGLADAEDIREILESVSVGPAGSELLLAPQFVNASLAAEAVIENGDNKTYGVGVNGDTLTITAMGGADLPFDAVKVAKSIKIAAALGANEIDGAGETAGTKLDAAGVAAATGADLVRVADAATVTATAKAITVDFDDASHKAIGISGSAGYVEKIQVTLRDSALKALSLKLKGGVTSLDGKFLVELSTVNTLESGSTSDNYFKWFPTGTTQIDLSALASGKITFTLPKELLRSNLATASVSFLDTKPATSDGAGADTVDGTATGELIATVNSNDLDVQPGVISVSLPLTLAGTNQSNLYAQRISQKVTGDDAVALEDTLVTAYLAKWQDKAVAGATTVAINGGKVSIPGDKWATEVALDLSATVGGANKQNAARNAAFAYVAAADVDSGILVGAATTAEANAVAADIANEYAAARTGGASDPVAQNRAYNLALGNLGTFGAGNLAGSQLTVQNAVTAAAAAYNGAASSTASVADLVSAINTQLAETKPAAVPAWVVVTRSNDLVKGGNNTGSANSENYVEARAALFGTQAAAVAAAGAESTVFEVAVDPKTGKISGRLTGELKLKATTATTTKRGLVFIDRDGSLSDTAAVQSFEALVKNGRIDALVGVDAAKVPADKDLAALLKDAFVLLVHTDKDNNTKLITSAETGASNFLPFAANLLNKDGLGQVQGTAAGNILDISKVGSTSVGGGSSWQLVGLNALSRAKGAKTALSLPRTLVGLNGFGTPTSVWSNDGAHKDLALTMLGNSVGTAVESKDKDVESVNLGSNASAEGFAFAFSNDGAGTTVFVANAAAADVKLKAGWNLVSLPKATKASAVAGGVTMLLTSDLKGSWVKSNASGQADADFNLPAGAPVFVYLKDAKAGDTVKAN